jgi:hypothetical protein
MCERLTESDTRSTPHDPCSGTCIVAHSIIIRALDDLWLKVNALGGVPDPDVAYDVGYVTAISRALDLVERCGGMEPRLRRRDGLAVPQNLGLEPIEQERSS